MDDALLVGGGQTASDLIAVVHRLAQGKPALGQERPQGRAVEKLGDEVGRLLVSADVEEGEEVRMVQRARGACFALEALQAVAVVGERRGQQLDRHLAAEAGVAGAIHLAHAPGPERAENLVGAETASGREQHGGVG